MRYLTKTRFVLALDCLTKLYYTKNPEYADENLDDPFLESLAEGGFQVGELAKYLFCENPSVDKITLDTLDPDEAIRETNRRLLAPEVVIAEAAFCYESLLIRTDLIVKKGNRIELYEVKAKSTDEDEPGIISEKGKPGIKKAWVPYVYDVAFQKYVMVKALAARGFEVSAHLILADKNKTTTVDGLNQKFKIIKLDNGRTKIETAAGLRRVDLGDPILTIVPVDDVIERVWNEFPVPTDLDDNISFENFVRLCSDTYSNNQRLFAPIGSKCRDCQFTNSSQDNQHLKSGFLECWKEHTKYTDAVLRKNLVLELWSGKVGKRSLIRELIQKGKYLIESIDEGDICSPHAKESPAGMTPHERRMEQITRVKQGTESSYFDKQGLENEMGSWIYPLHMIDFETTMTALPFHKGRHPYEGIPFQFSHHIYEQNGKIRHAGQFLSFEPGVFPNYDFVRELKAQLENDEGTIFRYHNHENTYLNIVHSQLSHDPHPPSDKEVLLEFIEHITKSTGRSVKKWNGPRAMVDLYDLVVKYYYSPQAKGSNSIKSILPAVISDSKHLKAKYTKPVYGKGKSVHSMNFDQHVWIQQECNNDPYKTLLPLFAEYDDDRLDRSVMEFGELASGGAAMTAYNLLQFSEIPLFQREELRRGLLRYCELDTMAMVMILEAWMNWDV